MAQDRDNWGALVIAAWRNIFEKGNKTKNTQGNRTPDYDILVCTKNKGGNIKTRQMFEANEMKVLKKKLGKQK